MHRGRFSECIFNLRLDRAIWHDLTQSRLWLGILLRPDAMVPINLFDGALRGDTRTQRKRAGRSGRVDRKASKTRAGHAKSNGDKKACVEDAALRIRTFLHGFLLSLGGGFTSLLGIEV